MISKEQLQQLKKTGGFIEITFPNLFDYVVLSGYELILKTPQPPAPKQETLDVDYKEVTETKLLPE